PTSTPSTLNTLITFTNTNTIFTTSTIQHPVEHFTTMQSMQMNVHRRADIPDNLRAQVLPIQVITPKEYFSLKAEAPNSSTRLIEAFPAPLTAREAQALNANPLLRDLSLILTGQRNPGVHFIYIIKAVAIALRDEFYRFSLEHLEKQQLSPPRVINSLETTGAKPETEIRVKVQFILPGKTEFVRYTLTTRNLPVDAEESEALMKHLLNSVPALVLAGQNHPLYPVEPLYKAVARVFRPPQKNRELNSESPSESDSASATSRMSVTIESYQRSGKSRYTARPVRKEALSSSSKSSTPSTRSTSSSFSSSSRNVTSSYSSQPPRRSMRNRPTLRRSTRKRGTNA
ncbi:hypothetical protein BJ165DRAFT_1562999, partial [Panaeolus papilionaceus]